MAKATEVPLGARVKDRITGLEGIAVSRTDWLYQCRRIAIQPEGLHEGKPHEVAWVDEPQVEVLQEGVIIPMAPTGSTLAYTGGPERAVPPRRDPR